MTLGEMMNRHHQLVRRLCNAAAGRGRARRVVVTGMGLVTCLGVGTDHVWPRLLAGECGITALADQKYSGIPCRVAGLVPRGDEIGQLNLDNHMSRSERRMMSLASSYALVAASEALRQAHWSPSTDEEKYQTGVAVGMGMVDLDEIVETGCTLQGEGGYRKVNPYFVPHILVNMAAGHISLKFSLKGVNHAVSTACTTGVHAIGDASRFIAHGDVDMMVCGGAEAAVTPLAMAGFARMRALSTSFNDRPTEASRPFDRDRNGFVMAEGAGILVLEELEHALARNAVIYGEILGYGLSGDANHVSSPSANGDGAYRCMQAALRDANADVSELGYINAHATSTPLGDDAESKAIAHLLGSHSPNVLVSSTKGAVGHMLGAAGAVEAIFTVMACNTAMSPPTVNCHNPNTEPCLNYVQNSAAAWQRKAGDRKVALTNSFGFGGTNASLCVAGFSRPSSAKHYFI